MEWAHIIRAVLSLVFVIGLLLLSLWAFKYCELKGLKCKLVKNLKSTSRLEIIELRRLDTKNMLALVRCDKREFLLLLGPSSNLLLNQELAPETTNE